MTTIAANGTNQKNTSHWFTLSDNRSHNFGVDDIINAYEKGCDDGYATYLKKTRSELKKNLQNSIKLLEDFFNEINTEVNNCNLMLLRLCDINKFDFIVALDNDVFYDDEKSKPIYKKSFDIRRLNSNIGISFMPNNGSLNIESLYSDNFIAIYGKPE